MIVIMEEGFVHEFENRCELIENCNDVAIFRFFFITLKVLLKS